MYKTFIFSGLVLFSNFAFSQESPSAPAILLPGSTNDLKAVTVAPAKYKRMATAGWDNEVLIFSTDSPYQLVQKLTGHAAQVNALAYSFQGNLFASGSDDMTVRLYDSMYRQIALKEDATIKHQSAIQSLVFDRNGRFLFSGDRDGRMIIWDIPAKAAVKSYETGNAINDLSLSANSGNLFIAHSDKQIKVFALAGGKVIRTLDGHLDMVNALALSPNNQYLLSGSNDKTARLWDLRSWKPLLVLQTESWKVTTVAFTDDSKYCVTGCNDGTIKVWETATGKMIYGIEYPEIYILDLEIAKDRLSLFVAGKIRDDKGYGLRVVPSGIPIPQFPIANRKILTPAQRTLDSIMQIRPLTRQDSIKYRSLLLKNRKPKVLAGQRKGNSSVQPQLDSAIILMTPIPGEIKTR